MVKICVDLYTREEIMSSKQLLDGGYLPSRLPRRQGERAMRATTEDLMKTVPNPQLNVPTCYAIAMDRLPPVDAAHCNVSAIVAELQTLRAEVRASTGLRKR